MFIVILGTSKMETKLLLKEYLAWMKWHVGGGWVGGMRYLEGRKKVSRGVGEKLHLADENRIWQVSMQWVTGDLCYKIYPTTPTPIMFSAVTTNIWRKPGFSWNTCLTLFLCCTMNRDGWGYHFRTATEVTPKVLFAIYITSIKGTVFVSVPSSSIRLQQLGAAFCTFLKIHEQTHHIAFWHAICRCRKNTTGCILRWKRLGISNDGLMTITFLWMLVLIRWWLFIFHRQT
jgi:hypothetical protein